MYRRILVALEGKETDQSVVSHAKTLAAQADTEFTLLRVIAVADDGGGGLGQQIQTEIGSSGWRRKQQAEASLAQLKGLLLLEGLRAESALVVGTGSEADEIVRYAAEHGHDLIVMAADGLPWYKRLLGSSLAIGVLRKATVPTLFVGNGRRKVPAERIPPQANPLMAALGNPEL